MGLGELIERLQDIKLFDDEEEAHVEADQALLRFINDERVTAAFNAIPKWYA